MPVVLHCVVRPAIQQACNSCSRATEVPVRVVRVNGIVW
jgi:hypothetical protein